MYKIYLIRNLNNGKGYVGITKQSLQDRLRQHGYSSSNCTIISKAIKKHGLKSFIIGEVTKASSKSKAEKLEVKFISKLNTMYSSNGYNLSSGGSYAGSHSELTRKKMSKARLGKKRPPMTQEQKGKISKTRLERGIKHSPETIEKVRQANLGRKYPKEFCQQISERQRGSDNPSARVVKASTGEVFGSVVEAADWCNGNKGGIANCARGLSKSSGKHPITGEKLSWTQVT